MKLVFPRVIDNGKMLRNFVQIVRSGVIGRKSFGSAPKRAAQAWFASRTPETIFRQSLGAQPSMADVIKMVRPSPANDKGEKDAVREALYGYLIGKDVDAEKLPPARAAPSRRSRRARAQSPTCRSRCSRRSRSRGALDGDRQDDDLDADSA